MALHKGKTEHAGAKHGRGAWTTKADAKVSARKRRRRADTESSNEREGK